MHLLGRSYLNHEWEIYRIAALCVLWSVYWGYLILSKRMRFGILSLLLFVTVFGVIFGSFAYNRYVDGLPQDVEAED